MDGMISIRKEKGYTSHDVVAKLRGILKQKRIGHTGTLDPEAEGVLPVCLGKATKVCEFLTEKEKTYRAVLLLGCITDTQDTTGTVLEEKEADCTEEEIRTCLKSFEGPQQQIPPMYSALKVNGKKLYELARAGMEVEREPRKIVIRQIQVEEIHLPRITMTVTCSKGTYIRTLCHDIGQALGCGGCMEALCRIRSGAFTLEQSVTLAEVEKHRDDQTLEEILLPVDTVFFQFEGIVLTQQGERFARNGNPVTESMIADRIPPQEQTAEYGSLPLGEEKWFRVYSPNQEFLAVYRMDEKRRIYTPVKMF